MFRDELTIRPLPDSAGHCEVVGCRMQARFTLHTPSRGYHFLCPRHLAEQLDAIVGLVQGAEHGGQA